ncbi:MAG: NfeD family protein [Clostridia bacterium]|nr:NfeD family protein [Clostridia bacterium]
MIDWWNSLSVAAQVFACIAVPASLVLLIQTVLMLIGIGSEGGDGDGGAFSQMFSFGEAEGDTEMPDEIPDGDVDPAGLDALRIFTVRGIIAFLVVFGWVGFVMTEAGVKLFISIPVAFVCGFAMMLLLAFLMNAVMKLRNEGNLDNRNALGVAGKVYLTIPAKRQGEGKVNIMLQGSYVERDAVTDADEDIPTGSEVVVTGISGQTTLVVMKK